MKVGISAIEYYLPEKVITNDFFKHAENDFLENKVGIKERHVAADNEFTSDMAVKAVNQLIEKNKINRNELEFMVLCTLSPDYVLPQTSAQVQLACELPTSIYTVDIRMGCTGFVHGLSIAQSLIAGMGFKKGLLVTADKFSIYLSYRDYNVDTLFSDAAAAILVEKDPKLFEIVAHDFGTDGRGVEHIIIPAGGSKERISEESSKFIFIKDGVERSRNYLHMNGRQVMKFADKTVPVSANTVLKKGGIKMEDLDWVIMHQANKLMLENLGVTMHIPKEKNYINLWNKGNTIASSIPIALKEIMDKGERVNHDKHWLVTGFGLGFAWGTTLLKYIGK
ncbi:MAG: ketoacyl-ACP synthase III [Pseudomonadota bacterium]